MERQPTASPRTNEHLSRMDQGPLQQVGPCRGLFRRGSRGGRRKQRQIQTIITRRMCVRPHSPNRTNYHNLIKIPISTSVNIASRQAVLHTDPSIYIINANSRAVLFPWWVPRSGMGSLLNFGLCLEPCHLRFFRNLRLLFLAALESGAPLSSSLEEALYKCSV